MKIHVHTLGCKVNQFESQALETMLTDRGHQITGENDPACECYIINTCAVTAESGRKSRQAIRRLHALNPEALVAVCGCYSQISPEDVEKLGADLVAGSGDRAQFLDDLEAVMRTRSHVVRVDEALKRRTYEPLPAGSLSGRTRAMLKIQDGCSNFCAYCVIPYARGPVRSLPVKDAARQAAGLAAEGYRELVITGIEIASYGRDLKTGETLADAVCAIADAAPGVRLRLGSLEPRVVTEEFCEKLRALPGLCPHFHLSLQSGCDDTLRRMKRRYDTARFYESVALLRAGFPGCGLTADLITGFPGETQAEFDATLEFIRKCAFSSMHIFPYSARPGTPAAVMENQVEKAVRQQRARLAAALAGRMEQEFLCSCIGTRQQVLFEQDSGGVCTGHAGNYAAVSVSGEGLHNAIKTVQITGQKDGKLWGNVVL